MVAENVKNGALAVATFAAVSFLAAGSPHARQYTSTAWMKASADFGIGRSAASLPTPLTASEIVGVLKDDGFPISVIAELAGVERKTIYSWLDGTTVVRPQNEERIAAMYAAIKSVTGGDCRYVHRVWRLKDQGVSLRDLVAEDNVDARAVAGVLTALKPAMERYARNDASRLDIKSDHLGNAALDDMPTLTLSSE